MALNEVNVYRSSWATSFYKYLFTPLFIAGFLVALIFTWSTDDQFLIEWRKSVTIIFFWGVAWLTILMVRLRSFEANRENFLVKTIRGEYYIEYKDIDWIYQPVLIRPVLVSIKYWDRKNGKSRRILLIHKMSVADFFNEIELVKFIRDRIITSNPNYDSAKEPSRWLPIVSLFLTGLLIALIGNFL